MGSLRKVKSNLLNGEFIFHNESGDTRNGFYHKSELFYNNRLIATNKSNYINRTWECYTYQSSMQNCIDILIDKYTNKKTNEYKQANNINRLTKNKKDKVLAELEKDNTYMALKEVKKDLELNYC